MPKWSNLASLWKTKVCCQTVLPDRSVLIGQNWVENAKKMVHLGEFLKTLSLLTAGRSVLIGQKLVKDAKIQKFKCDILSNFQTMCASKIELSMDLKALSFYYRWLKVRINIVDDKHHFCWLNCQPKWFEWCVTVMSILSCQAKKRLKT